MVSTNVFEHPFNRVYSGKSGIHRLLLIAVAFSGLLLAARIAYTGSLAFIFLAWNLFLAFVPYFLSQWLTITPSWRKNKWKLAAVFIAWLLFIPNSFYIVTDLFHLHQGSAVPPWYDLLLIFTFAWNGLLMGILSVRQMEKIAEGLWPGRHEGFFVYPVMWLNAFGVYIGRYLRFNSWDVVNNPLQLATDIGHILAHPLVYKNAWGMITCFSVFLAIFYTTIRKMSRAVL
jgi:uncharacterized membrane protein